MCFACETETRCDHPLSECVAVEGDYCVGCHHMSIRLPQPPQPEDGTNRPGPRRLLEPSSGFPRL
jgi:hypothetical protein